MVWYSIVYPFGWWFQICFFPPEKGDDDPKVMSMLSPSYPQYTTITAASRPGTRVRMSYPPQEPSLISLFCGFFKSRKKQTTYIYTHLECWPTWTFKNTDCEDLRSSAKKRKSLPLRVGHSWHGCCDWKLAAKTHSQFEASKRSKPSPWKPGENNM